LEKSESYVEDVNIWWSATQNRNNRKVSIKIRLTVRKQVNIEAECTASSNVDVRRVMRREDILALFPEVDGVRSITDEQLNQIMGLHGASTNSLRQQVTDPSTLAELTRKALEYDKLDQANLTDVEKLTQQLADANKAKADYEAKFNRLEVEKILVSGGLDVDKYEKIVNTMVSGTLDESKELANNFVTLMKENGQASAQSAQQQAMANTPTPKNQGNQPGEKYTKQEQIAIDLAKANTRNTDGLSKFLE